ncbi:MAG: radical SAM protein [Candidatus Electrothrix scaldis]|nr:MAG: radical SAM protein [Candidatus Electrothrix sp. GW3-3]
MTEQREQEDQACSCPAEQSDIKRYFAQASQARIPLAACFELTRRCTFRCVHCYLGDQKEIHRHRYRELDTEKVLALFDEMVDAGTLFLHLTGGDPMLRPDFLGIYQQAVRRGLLVTVFCNGTLITDEIIRTFVKYPPRVVEITLYGATAPTFEAITQKKGSFAACMKGIERLRQAKVRLRLKTMVMTLNVDEFSAMRQLAEDMGLQFRHDCSLHGALPNDDNGGKSNTGRSLHDPLQYRLPPEQAAAVDMSVDEVAVKLIEQAQSAPLKKRPNKLYQCSAGKSAFHVTPYGRLQPCLMIVQTYGLTLGRNGIQAGWNGRLKQFTKCTATSSFPCNSCPDRGRICTICPGIFSLASGNPEEVDSFYCQYAEHRDKEIKKIQKGVSNECK